MGVKITGESPIYPMPKLSPDPPKTEEPSTPAPLLSAEERWKAIDLVRASLEKEHKLENPLVRMGDKVGKPIPSISTGLITWDDIFDCGGVPRGRIIEFIGPESSGKTTAALQVVAEAQKLGEMAAYIDAEHALDVNYAKKLGVDVDNLLVSQPDCGEDALNIVEALVKSRAVSVIIVDSVAALVPRAELEGEMGESHMGLQARLMSQACRKLRGICNTTGTTLIFINQLRDKIGVTYGSPETTTGGRALRFYASVRLDIRRLSDIKEGDEVIGQKIRIRAIKNKCGLPKREAELDLYHGKGFDTLADVLQIACREGIVQQAGGWFTFKSKKYRKADLDEAQIRQAIKEHNEKVKN